jgi:hypothetical protein
VELTREQIAAWLQEYNNLPEDNRLDQRSFFEGKLKSIGQDQAVVNTEANDSLDDVTPLLDLIMADISSYG